jgi:hypothetical protein
VTDITPNFEEGEFAGRGNRELRAHDAFESRLDVVIRTMASPESRMAERGVFSHARLPGPWKTSAFMAVLVLRGLLVASPSSAVVIDNFSKSE